MASGYSIDQRTTPMREEAPYPSMGKPDWEWSLQLQVFQKQREGVHECFRGCRVRQSTEYVHLFHHSNQGALR